MQTVKKDFIKGVEAEGDFRLTKISDQHLAELKELLNTKDIKYGDVKAVLSKFKHEIIPSDK